MPNLKQVDKNLVSKTKSASDPEASRIVRELRSNMSQTGGEVQYSSNMVLTFVERQRSALLMSIILLAIAFFVFLRLEILALQPAIIWACVQLVSYLLIHQMCRAAQKKLSPYEDASNWEWRFIILNFITGSAWGGLVIWCAIASTQPVYLQILFGFIVVYICNATQISSSLRYAPMAASIPPVICFCIAAAQNASLFSLTLASILPGIFIFITAIASKLRETEYKDLKFKAEKDSVIADLELAHTMADAARRKAEDASLTKSRFLASMSHELRTPLNAILGFSEVMSKQLLGPMENQNYREYSEDINASGQHLLSLINEILDLSRIEAGRYQLHEKPIALKDVIFDAMSMIELKAASKDIQLETRLQEDLPLVMADEKAIRQILLNLLSNAVKFTSKGGQVILKLGWTSNGGQYFSVTDNGPGIQEDEIALVMSPFGQGSIAVDTAEQGSGLGLPIVKAMTEMHQGIFSISSKLREGTVVTVKLPHARVLDTLPVFEAHEVERRVSKANRGLTVAQAPNSTTPEPSQTLDLSRQSETPSPLMDRMRRVTSERS